jgi:hypothetical protein
VELIEPETVALVAFDVPAVRMSEVRMDLLQKLFYNRGSGVHPLEKVSIGFYDRAKLLD